MEDDTRDPTALAVIPRARSVGSSGLWIRVLALDGEDEEDWW